MVKLYVKYIKLGKYTIEDVPELWKTEVEEALKENEKSIL